MNPDQLVVSADSAISAISLPLTYSTATSNGTAIGIGSVAGRVIQSVGELALKGVEVVHIQRTISAIYVEIVASEGKVKLDDARCAHLLELSRRGVYSTRVLKKAWASILLLIAAGNTGKLIDHILNWRDADIKQFLVELVKTVPRGLLVVTLGDPLPVSKHARHLQASDSRLPMQLVYFLYNLLEASAIRKGLPTLRDAQSSVLSLASFVNEAGKVTINPDVLLRDLNVHVGHTAIASIVKFYMCTRLNRISTMLRTFTGLSSPTKGYFDLHSEVLEIYRLFAHDRGVQRQTKELLFISITRFHAVPLVRTLGRWSPEFLRLFIILVMRWTLSFVKPSLSMDDSTLPKAYRIHLALHAKGQHPVLPFLFFFNQLALENSLAAKILIELNIIPVLRTMCINNYPNPALYATTPHDSKAGLAISDVCAMSIMLIGSLSTYAVSCRKMLRLRDFPRWFLSFYYNSEFIGIPDAPLLQQLWIQLEKPLLRLVLGCIEYVLKDEALDASPQEADYLPLEPMYREILGVLRDSSSEPELLQSASDSLFRCIALKGEFVNVLDVTFARDCRSEETIAVLRTAARSLGLCPASTEDTPEPTSPYLERDVGARSRPASGAVPPFPLPGTPLRDVKRYVDHLAFLYTDDLRIYTALVAELIGSQACNARYALIDRWSSSQSVTSVHPMVSQLPDHSSAASESLYSFKTVTSILP